MPRAQQPTPRPWFRIEPRAAAADQSPDSADVYIYDEIGESFWGGGIAPKALVDEISALDVGTLNVYVNSPGGVAWDGITIMNALRRHPARVEVTVDGIAASAASVIAMAGDKVTMNRGAELMVHDAWGWAQGNAKDMADTGEALGRLSDSIADIYAAKAGGDRAQWREVMQAETWYTAEEAVAAGLADAWVDAPATPAAQASFDLSRFRFRGRAQAPTPRLAFEAPEPPRSAEPGHSTREEDAVPYSNLTAGLRERLGVTDADASDETLLAALDEALTEQPATPALPEGIVPIDSQVLASLQSDAAAGREAREEQNRARREGIVNAALAAGQIAPASRAQFLALVEKDEPGTVALIATLPKNSAVAVDPMGHSDQPAIDEEDAVYVALFGSEKKEA